MGKIETKRPLVILLYGFPGSGKSYFARQICQTIQAVQLSDDKLRGELFDKPRYDKAENSVIAHLLEYMSSEFLNAGISVVIDTDVRKHNYRRHLRELAKKHHSKDVLLWFQIDADTAFDRLKKRDKRKTAEKFSKDYSRTEFDEYASAMQHPSEKEDYIVLSGKHSYLMQQSTLLRRLYDWGLVSSGDLSKRVVKPGLMSLVPEANKPGNRKLHIR